MLWGSVHLFLSVVVAPRLQFQHAFYNEYGDDRHTTEWKCWGARCFIRVSHCAEWWWWCVHTSHFSQRMWRSSLPRMAKQPMRCVDDDRWQQSRAACEWHREIIDRNGMNLDVLFVHTQMHVSHDGSIIICLECRATYASIVSMLSAVFVYVCMYLPVYCDRGRKRGHTFCDCRSRMFDVCSCECHTDTFYR